MNIPFITIQVSVARSTVRLWKPKESNNLVNHVHCNNVTFGLDYRVECRLNMVGSPQNASTT